MFLLHMNCLLSVQCIVLTAVRAPSITLMQKWLGLEGTARLHTPCWVEFSRRVSSNSSRRVTDPLFGTPVSDATSGDAESAVLTEILTCSIAPIRTSAVGLTTAVCVSEQQVQTPGPGTYSPEKAPPCNLQRRPPCFTMRSRTQYRSSDSVPAPNKYCLPPVMGPQVPNKPSSASYTMSRSYSTGGPSVDLAKTPGPCRYNTTDLNLYLPRQPAFSMLGRHKMPRDATKKPGPGEYNPEKVTVTKARAPAFSLGVRHSEFVTPLVLHVPD